MKLKIDHPGPGDYIYYIGSGKYKRKMTHKSHPKVLVKLKFPNGEIKEMKAKWKQRVEEIGDGHSNSYGNVTLLYVEIEDQFGLKKDIFITTSNREQAKRLHQPLVLEVFEISKN